MSYYPDADEIRMAYVSHNKSDAYGCDAETLEVEFNRWFEYEQSKVVLATEERIIKLLEEQQIRFISNGFWTEGVAVRASIALIKGENK